MAFQLDADIASVLAAAAQGASGVMAPDRGDALALPEITNATLATFFAGLADSPAKRLSHNGTANLVDLDERVVHRATPSSGITSRRRSRILRS